MWLRSPGGCRAIRGNPTILHIKVSFSPRVISKALKEVVGPGEKRSFVFSGSGVKSDKWPAVVSPDNMVACEESIQLYKRTLLAWNEQGSCLTDELQICSKIRKRVEYRPAKVPVGFLFLASLHCMNTQSFLTEPSCSCEFGYLFTGSNNNYNTGAIGRCRGEQAWPMRAGTDQRKPVGLHTHWPHSRLRLCDHCAALL